MKDLWDTYYVLIIILGVGTILSFVWIYFFNKNKLNLKWWGAIISVVAAVLVGVLALRFFALLESGFDVNKSGRLSFFGGIFVLPLFAFVFSKIAKIKMGDVLDAFTVVLIILSFGRISCIVTGCCYGKYIGTSDIRYPTREIELVYDSIALIAFIILNLKKALKGKLYFIHLMGYGFLRFVIEFMRHSDNDSVLHIGHGWAILSFLIGLGFLIYLTVSEKSKLEADRKK